jgi:hypothetical protein
VFSGLKPGREFGEGEGAGAGEGFHYARARIASSFFFLFFLEMKGLEPKQTITTISNMDRELPFFLKKKNYICYKNIKKVWWEHC